MAEAYSLVCKVRAIFKINISREKAKEKLHKCYREVSNCTLREVKTARDAIRAKEEHVLNYFTNRSTYGIGRILEFED